MPTRLSTSILMAVLGLAAACTASATDFERVVSADPQGSVEITNVAGEVEVSGWDRPEVSVSAEYGSSVNRIDVLSQPGRTVVRVVLPGGSWQQGSWGSSADLKVRLPRASRVTVSTVSADVTSTGIEGSQTLRSVGGDITAELGGGDEEVSTVSGDIRLHGRGQEGSTRVTTISGDTTLDHAAGDLEVNAVSGDVDVRLDSARSVRLRTTSGDVTFNGWLVRGGGLDAESVSGELKVRAPSQDGYQYDASSFSGGIEDCFDVEPQRTSRYGPGTRLNGTLGKGSAQVRLKTMSGSVELCDR